MYVCMYVQTLVERCMELTGVDGVMSSEAILENPALFAEPPVVTCPVLSQVELAGDEPPLIYIGQLFILKYMYVCMCMYVYRSQLCQQYLSFKIMYRYMYVCIAMHKIFLIILEQYLDYCELYPVHPPKCVRSHMLKFLYRYTVQHTVLRDMCGVSHTLDDYRNVCKVKYIIIF
jgi:tRNA-dihydrouridine synthase